MQDVINTTENKQFLYNYLQRYLIQERNKSEKQAKQLALGLIKKNKNNLFDYGGLAWWLGQKSLEYFCLMWLQDIFVPKPNNQARQLSETHFEVWDLLEKCLIKDEFDRLVLCLPRGFAKSTIVTLATVIHQAVYAKGFFQIVIGKTEADAQNFIFDVRKQLEENELILYTFGKLIDTKNFTVNKNELHLTNNCKILALSSTSSIRGRKHLGKRPDRIILDDTQGLNDIVTDEAKQKKWDTFSKDVLFAGDEAIVRDGKVIKSATKFLVCGTVLAPDCFISRLLKEKSFKSIVKRAILVDDIDALFANEYWSRFKEIYFDNKNQYAEIDAKNFYYDNIDKMQFPVLWPDKWDCLSLAISYFNNPYAFKQEMMNIAENASGSRCFFNVKTIPRIEMEKIEFDRTMMTVDCAVETGENNDFTAVCIGSRGLNGHRYIRKGMIYKKEFDDSVHTVFELLKQYIEITHVVIERNTFQGRFAAELQKLVNEDSMLRHRNIVITEERQLGNKENRIRAIAGKVNNGFIIFCEEDEEFYNQILEYRGSKVGHDDAADALEMLDARIDEIKVIKPLKFFDRSLLFGR